MTAAVWALALVAVAALPAQARKTEPTKVERPQFVVELREEPGAGVIVELVARGGFHVNAEYPMSFDAYDRKILRDAFKVETARARATIPVPPRAARASGILAFSVCDPEQCLIEKIALELVLARPR